MGEIIDLRPLQRTPPADLICLRPFEFRRPGWVTGHFVQMLKSESQKMRARREEIHRKGEEGLRYLPPHISLKGGLSQTIRCLYACREDEQRMRAVYYLMGLMDCMVNQVNPVLRTDLLRDMYKKVFRMKRELGVHWYGPLDQVLIPIDARFYRETEYRSRVNRAETLKELYEVIRRGCEEMFDILSLEYAFYCPNRGG